MKSRMSGRRAAGSAARAAGGGAGERGVVGGKGGMGGGRGGWLGCASGGGESGERGDAEETGEHGWEYEAGSSRDDHAIQVGSIFRASGGGTLGIIVKRMKNTQELARLASPAAKPQS